MNEHSLAAAFLTGIPLNKPNFMIVWSISAKGEKTYKKSKYLEMIGNQIRQSLPLHENKDEYFLHYAFNH